MKSRSVLILIVLAILFRADITAAATKYFEYAPDAWQTQRLAVAAGETPYLLFDAPGSFDMTGFDLWLDNPGTGGTVAFTLRNNNDSVLATKSVALATIPQFPGGNRYHVNWNAPMGLTAGQTYSIEIGSSLADLGLYYVDRVSIVEQNRDMPSPYALGGARLGDQIQTFTFKYALYQTGTSGNSTSIAPEQTITASSTTPTEISITGARLASVTDTTALFAWTSNIAADSKVSIRTQLNPLYVVASGYDPTLELEHTVLVTGLHANINYFADVFSSDGDQLTLTTYTIGFKTLTASAAAQLNPQQVNQPPASPPPAQPVPAPPTTNQQNQNPTPPAASNNTQNNNTSNATPSSSNSNGLSVSASGGGSGIDISWDAPAGAEPSGGYRIDVFDYNYRLKRQILIPAAAGAHSQTVDGLAPGANHIIVYANEKGAFTKVAPSKDFTFTPGSGDIVNKLIIISLAWAAGLGGWLYWKSRKNKLIMPTV